MQNIESLNKHPDYWATHKRLWDKEFDDLDPAVARLIMDDPDGAEAQQLQKKVIIKVEKALFCQV